MKLRLTSKPVTPQINMTNEEALKVLKDLGTWQQEDEGTYAKPGIHTDGIRVLSSPVLLQYADTGRNGKTPEFKLVSKALDTLVGSSGWSVVPHTSNGVERSVHVEITNPAMIVELAPELAPGKAVKEPRIPGSAFAEKLAANRAASSQGIALG